MVDVTVRGAGIFGLSVAWACARRGAVVRVVDPAGVGAGSSGGIVGALAPHVPENWNAKKAFQLDALLMAEGYWREVETTGGLSAGYARTGRLQPIADDRTLDLARQRADGAQTLWQGRAAWIVERAFDGWCPPSPTGWVIRDTLSARVHPRNACAALAAAVQARGGAIVGAARDEGSVVWATGHADLTAHVLGNGVKGQAALFALDAGPEAPQLFADALHFVPHADGTLAVGSTSERDWDDPAATDAGLDALIDRARTVLPILAEASVLARWAGVRPRAQSRAPLLGQHPAHPGHYIANGGFKIGFGVAPMVGEVMADLLLEGRNRIPEDFKPP